MLHDTGSTRRRVSDGWTISDSGIALSWSSARESVRAVGAGCRGRRGTPDEGGPAAPSPDPAIDAGSEGGAGLVAVTAPERVAGS
jgi:hypothetical protein